MKLSDLTPKQLKVLKEWKDTECYKILYELVETRKNSDATMLGKEIPLAPNEFEAVKIAMKRVYVTQGMKELLLYPTMLDKRELKS